MKKTVLRKMSNPKSINEYFKMFDKFVKNMAQANEIYAETWSKFDLDKIHQEILDEEKASNIHDTKSPTRNSFSLFILSQSPLDPVEGNDDKYKEFFESVVSSFIKNDRIESYLKHYRAWKCNEITDAYESWVRDQNSVHEKLIEPIKYFLNKFKTIYEYCKKERESYLSKTEKTEAETRSQDTLNWAAQIADLKHFIDVYNTDKNKFRILNEYSWTNKTPAKIIYDLSELENEIRSTKTKSKKEYEEKLEEASKTEEYLPIDKNLKWYIIENYECSFEAYLNGHCGTDSSADVLFSLRSFKDGMFESHVTISASIQTLDKNIFQTPAIFVVKQVKGKGNNKPNDRYWDAIIKLFESEEFGYQVQGSYKPENDFHTYDLDEVEENKFLKKKPWWNNYLKAQLHYKLISTTKTRILKKETWKAEETSFDENGEFNIHYHSFLDMLLGLSEQWGGREDVIKKQYDYIEEYDEFTNSYSDIPFDDYFLYIKNVKKPIYNKIVDAMELLELQDISEIKDLQKNKDIWDILNNTKLHEAYDYLNSVLDAMDNAYATGYEVGSQTSKYEAYERFWDELKLELDGNEMGEINKTKDGKWIVTIYPEAVMAYSEENGEFGIPDPEKECFEPKGRNGIEWEWDYDEDAAAERLFEELPE